MTAAAVEKEAKKGINFKYISLLDVYKTRVTLIVGCQVLKLLVDSFFSFTIASSTL